MRKLWTQNFLITISVELSKIKNLALQKMKATTNSNMSLSELSLAILTGKRSVLAKAITLAESTLDSDRQLVEHLLKQLLPHTGKSIRIGITGVPGVGKSTFIEVFGEQLASAGKKIGVLTIDPSSQKTKGSILGDKTRMEQLSRNPHVFIRPSPSALALGGVSYHTREAVLLCEAAGFDVILVETVGVGQSETYVRSMVDFFLLLMLAGAGDELQGIKKGITEMADGIVITKADGENLKATRQAHADASQAQHFQTPSPSGWKTKVLTVSVIEKRGLTEVWKMIQDYKDHALSTGYFHENRKLQQKQWLEESVDSYFRELMGEPQIIEKKEELLKEVMKNILLPTDAARQLWDYVVSVTKK